MHGTRQVVLAIAETKATQFDPWVGDNPRSGSKIPKRLCIEAGCPNPAHHRGRCQTHSHQQDLGINRSGREVYNSKRWKMLRRAKLGRNSICERCDEQLATEVHHRYGVTKDPWSIDGLEALCASCHSKQTRRDQLN